MRLLRLEVQNFRAFYGNQVLEFSRDESRPVTVIHGENGAGKTNLLNALYWGLTGEFTPRLSNPNLLLNKAAYQEDKSAEGYVEILFDHEGTEYRVRRTIIRQDSRLDVFKLSQGNSSTVQNPKFFIERIIPKALSKWFFFDAEAIGELELSGSEEFKRSLRRTLGFELVDSLVDDLALAQSKRQKALANLVNSKDLKDIQDQIDKVQCVLPGQKQQLETVQDQLQIVNSDLERVDRQLRDLPKSRPLQERRQKLSAQLKMKQGVKAQLVADIAKTLGEYAPGVIVSELALAFDSQLQIKENSGKLPAPYSDQLVRDILNESKCICGREVLPNTDQEENIKSLLKSAATGSLNARIKTVQYLIRDIDSMRGKYPEHISSLRQRLLSADEEIADIDEQIKDVGEQLAKIDEEAVSRLESERAKCLQQYKEHSQREGALLNFIDSNERKLRELQARYDNLVKRVGQGDSVKRELEKIKKISGYITRTLKKQELRALTVLSAELNRVLKLYLTKHYQAKINPSTYEVRMLDSNEHEVGRSTGEGQVLKFAFVSTVVGLAGRKTKEKIDFMAEPTVAPLVLDAPFSALDPEYQSSVATNLATQASQLVLLLSSAAWGDGVAKALDQYVGKRYVLLSRQEGPRGDKPVKTMMLGNKTITLNEYDADRDESVIMEL